MLRRKRHSLVKFRENETTILDSLDSSRVSLFPDFHDTSVCFSPSFHLHDECDATAASKERKTPVVLLYPREDEKATFCCISSCLPIGI
jgi:hypothetical protein